MLPLARFEASKRSNTPARDDLNGGLDDILGFRHLMTATLDDPDAQPEACTRD